MNTNMMARLLARRLEEEGERAGAEISLEELLERWVPYGVARSSLDLTTKSEYDLLVLEFLADGRLTVLGDSAVAEAAAEELETPEPGLEPLEEHAGVSLRLDLATISGGYRGSDAVDPEDGDAAEEAESDAGGDAPDAGDADSVDAVDSDPVEAWDPTGGVDARPTGEAHEGAGDGPEESDDPVDIGAGRAGRSATGEHDREHGRAGDEVGPEGDCRSCGEPLPVDVDVPVRFCPTCGAARPERACPECDARLRPEWSYCPACGTHASPSGGISEPGGAEVDADEWEPE